jgi:hypothetical protein
MASSSNLAEVSGSDDLVSEVKTNDDEIIISYDFEAGTVVTPEIVKELPHGITHLDMMGVVGEERLGFSSLFSKVYKTLQCLSFDFGNMANGNTKMSFTKAFGRYFTYAENNLRRLSLKIDTKRVRSGENKEGKKGGFLDTFIGLDRLEYLHVLNMCSFEDLATTVDLYGGMLTNNSLTFSVGSFLKWSNNPEKRREQQQKDEPLLYEIDYETVNATVQNVGIRDQQEGFEFFLQRTHCRKLNLTVLDSWPMQRSFIVFGKNAKTWRDTHVTVNMSIHETIPTKYDFSTLQQKIQKSIIDGHTLALNNKDNMYDDKDDEFGTPVTFSFSLKVILNYWKLDEISLPCRSFRPAKSVTLNSVEVSHPLFTKLVLPVFDVEDTL